MVLLHTSLVLEECLFLLGFFLDYCREDDYVHKRRKSLKQASGLSTKDGKVRVSDYSN